MSVTGDPRRDEDAVRHGLETGRWLARECGYESEDAKFVESLAALDRLTARLHTLEQALAEADEALRMVKIRYASITPDTPTPGELTVWIHEAVVARNSIARAVVLEGREHDEKEKT